MIDLCGQLDGNLLKIEIATDTKILRNGNSIEILGSEKNSYIAIKILNKIYKSLEKGNYLDQGDLEAAIRIPKEIYNKEKIFTGTFESDVIIKTQQKKIFPRSSAQKEYLNLFHISFKNKIR